MSLSEMEKGIVMERKMSGSRAPHRQSAKHRKWLLSKKHYFPMARRLEIDAFQNSDNSNSQSFGNYGKPCISWKSKNGKCLKSNSCISRKSLKNKGKSCIPRAGNHTEFKWIRVDFPEMLKFKEIAIFGVWHFDDVVHVILTISFPL